MTDERWQVIRAALAGGNWLTEEQGREVVAEVEAMRGQLESASAVLTALGHPDDSKSLAQRITEAREESMGHLRMARAEIERLNNAMRQGFDVRLRHAHDAANALYRAAGAIVDLWNDEERLGNPDHLSEAIDAIERALDPQQAAAALAEVQRRNLLDKRLAETLEEARESSNTIGELRTAELEWRREREELRGRLNNESARADAQHARANDLEKERDALLRVARPRLQLTEEAARAWARRLVGDGACGVRFITQLVEEALQQAANGGWPTLSDVGVEAITHEFRPGAYPVVDPIERETVPITAGAPALTITLAAPSPAKSTREIHEQLIRQWEQAAAHEGAPIEQPPPAHDTAEMAVTTGETAHAGAPGPYPRPASWPITTPPELAESLQQPFDRKEAP